MREEEDEDVVDFICFWIWSLPISLFWFWFLSHIDSSFFFSVVLRLSCDMMSRQTLFAIYAFLTDFDVIDQN